MRTTCELQEKGIFVPWPQQFLVSSLHGESKLYPSCSVLQRGDKEMCCEAAYAGNKGSTLPSLMPNENNIYLAVLAFLLRS